MFQAETRQALKMDKFKKLRIESDWAGKLKLALSKFGIKDYYYTCFYQYEDRVSTCSQKVIKRASYEKIRPVHMKNMRYCSSDSNHYLSLMDWLLSSKADKCNGFYRNPSWQVEIVNSELKELKVQTAFDRIGLHSSALYEVPSTDGCGFMGFFALNSGLEYNSFQFQLAKHDQSLKTLLSTYHRRFVSENMTLLNPWVNTGAVSAKSVNILQMLANGFSPIDIAEEQHLTRRGVDYHLDLLRINLNANSRNHLLAKSCYLNILNAEKVLFTKNDFGSLSTN